jgi:cytochrome c oxidase subunit IV
MSNDSHSMKPYTMVFGALMVLTVITVAISRVDLGKPMNWALGLAVACVKASLVVMIFMHLKHEKRSWLGMVLIPLLLVLIIVFINFPDTGLNSSQDGGELLSPALKIIPHAGRAAGGH